MRAVVGLLMIAGMATACSSGCRQAPPAHVEQIRSLVAAYDRAIDAKDRGRLQALMFEDFVYFTSGGQVRTRDAFLDFLTSADYEPESRERDELKIHLAAGTAVVESRWRGTGTYAGRPFDDDQRCSLIFARVGQEWRLAAEHCTPVVE